MKAVFAAVLGVACFAFAGNAQAQDDNAKKIVGTWEVTKAQTDVPVGTVVEFTKDNKIHAVIKADGMEVKIDGTYEVKKDKLTLKLKLGEQSVEQDATIKKLTDDVMELEDKDKKVDELKKKKK